MILSSFSTVFAQQVITGTVVNKGNGQPLPGVTIVVKGTNNGTTTDFAGNFNINSPADGVLLLTYIGFLSQEVEIDGATNLQITLDEDVAKLDEVVVVGYGTIRKSDITGAVASVKVEELQSIPTARADEVLQGQVAGVRINNNDASPNANVSIRIRGVSSINGGSSPLIVIDGVQGAKMADVHPNDIKSMEVLKDASATAVYGSRGASGVILITTKTISKERKPTLSYNTYTTIDELRRKLELLSPGEYARYINENRYARSLPLVFSDEEIARFDAGGGTDWQDAIFKLGTTHNHHVNLIGKTGSTSYSISGDFLETKGIVLSSRFKRFSVRPNILIELNDNLLFTLNSFVNLSKDNPIILDSRGTQGSPMFAMGRFSPTKSIYNDDGTYTQPGDGAGPNDEYNPVALAVEPIRDHYSNKMILNSSVQYTFLKGLTATFTGSYQLVDDEENFYLNEKVINGHEDDRTASIFDSRYTNFQNTNFLTYEIVLGKHDLKFTGLYEQQKSNFNSNYSSSRGFLTNAVTYNDLSLGSAPGIPVSTRHEQSLESFMGRLNYSFDGKYLLTFTGRSDAASVFAENNKRAFFPSVAVGWNISKEKFLAESNTFDYIKLKGSYGEVGNAAIGPYQSLAQLVTGSNFSFDGDRLSNGITLSTQAPNPDLKWETTEQWNVGIELSMLKNRVGLSANYYKKNTTDLLLERTLLQASGFQTQLVNAGEVENEGIELLLEMSPMRNKNFKWDSTFIFSNNENEVLALNGGETEIPLGGAGLPGLSNSIWLQVGEPIGLIRGFDYDGVWKSDEAILARSYGVTPGSPKYVDQNNDGQINDEDIVNIANALPDFTFSINNTFGYKHLDLKVLIIGVQGNDLYNISRLRFEERDNGTARSLLNVWTSQNEDTDIPGHNAMGSLRNSDRWVENGSYVRIKNIILGYNFPKNISDTIKVSSARIYVSGSNLFTFTNYTGFDPELNSSGGSDTFAGIDLASFPSQKRYTIGLDIKF